MNPNNAKGNLTMPQIPFDESEDNFQAQTTPTAAQQAINEQRYNAPLTVGKLIEILKFLPPALPIIVLTKDGTEELEFGRPIVTRINMGALAVINVVVKP